MNLEKIKIQIQKALLSPLMADKTKAVRNVNSLISEIERLRLVLAFHCSTGALSVAQVATALNMSQAEVKELMKKLPSPASRSQANEVTK